jgi:hypothetical protein
MRRRDLEAKFAAYAHYVRSCEWRTDGNTPLPHLLVVTSDIGQENRLLAVLASAFAGTPSALVVRISLRDQLIASGPLAAIWRVWTRGASDGHVRLSRPARLFDDDGTSYIGDESAITPFERGM